MEVSRFSLAMSVTAEGGTGSRRSQEEASGGWAAAEPLYWAASAVGPVLEGAEPEALASEARLR